MFIKRKIRKKLDGGEVSKALGLLDRYAKNHPRHAEDLGRQLFTKTDFMKDQVKNDLQTNPNNYKNIHYGGTSFIVANCASPGAKRFIKPAVALLTVSVLIFAGLAYYDDNIRDIPMESVEVFAPYDEFVAGEYYEFVPIVYPEDCRDKTLRWSVDNRGITLGETEDGFSVKVSMLVPDGETFTLTAFSEKYKFSKTFTYTVENDLELTLESNNSTVFAGAQLNFECSNNKESFNPVYDWYADVSWVKVKGNGPNASVSVDLDAKAGDFFTITAQIASSCFQVSMMITVDESFAMELVPSKKNPVAGDKITFELETNHPLGTHKVVWKEDSDSCSISGRNTKAELSISYLAGKGSEVMVTAEVSGTELSADYVFKVTKGLELSFSRGFSSLDAGDSFSLTLKTSVPMADFVLEWDADEKWVGIRANGRTVTVTVDIGARSGESFELSVFIPSLGLSHRETFEISGDVDPRLEFISGVDGGKVSPGTTAVIECRSPVVPAGIPLNWTVEGESVTYEQSGNKIYVTVDERILHGSEIKVTASYEVLGRTVSKVLSVDNEAMKAIDIDSAEGLRGISDNPAGYYRMASDIDLGSVPWDPVEFTGVLEGNGHSIRGLVIDIVHDSRSTSDIGLFSKNYGEVKNLCVEGAFLAFAQVDISSELIIENVGIVCGTNFGKVSDCSVTGKIFAHSKDYQFFWSECRGAGFGPSNPVLEEIPAFGSEEWVNWISLKFMNTFPNNLSLHETRMAVGGAVGNNHGTVDGTSSNVDIDAKLFNMKAYVTTTGGPFSNGYIDVGGICGTSTGLIVDSYSAGDVSGYVFMLNVGKYGGWVKQTDIEVGGGIGKISGSGKSSGCRSDAALITGSMFEVPTYPLNFNNNKLWDKELSWGVNPF